MHNLFMQSVPHLPIIQALRAIAALMVVVMHLGGSLPFLTGPFPRFFYWFCFSGVDLFFAISGFVMVYAHLGDAGRPKQARRFVRLRLIRIFPNYLFFALCAHLLVATLDYRADASINWLASYSLWPQSWQTHLLPVAWTLSFELLFYTIFALLLCLPARWFAKGLLLWTLIILAAQPLIDYSPHFNWENFLFSAYQLEFLAGAWAAWLLLKPVRWPAKAMVAAGVLLWLAVMIASTYFIEASLLHRTERLWRGALLAIAFGPLLYGLAALALRTPRWLQRIGDASYTLYLVHLPLLYVWMQMAQWIAPNAKGWGAALFVYVPTYLTVCIGYSLWHHRQIEKPLTQWLRRN